MRGTKKLGGQDRSMRNGRTGNHDQWPGITLSVIGHRSKIEKRRGHRRRKWVVVAAFPINGRSTGISGFFEMAG